MALLKEEKDLDYWEFIRVLFWLFMEREKAILHRFHCSILKSTYLLVIQLFFSWKERLKCYEFF